MKSLRVAIRVNWLSHFFLLLNVINVIAADDHKNALKHSNDSLIRGIDIYNNTIAVAVDKEVYIGQIKNGNIVDIARIPLNELVSERYGGDTSLLEFKLLNESSVLRCTAECCSICSQSSNLLPNCSGIEINKRKWRGVSVTLGNEDVAIKFVDDKGNASIETFHLWRTDNNATYSSYGRQSFDASSFRESETVAAFSTLTHFYFVGSGKRTYYQLEELRRGQHPWYSNMDVRITQICNRDTTDNLRSRIDLVLSCEGIDYNQMYKTITNKATAALYLPELSKLLVAFQHGENSANENYICSYNFTELQNRFARTWDKCQNIPSEITPAECEGQNGTFKDLKEECFLFSWDNHNPLPFCSAYNGAIGDNQFDNCELSTSNNTDRAYGSLENYKPYDGKLLFKENHTSPIVAIRKIQNKSIVYALRKDNTLIQFSTDERKKFEQFLEKQYRDLLIATSCNTSKCNLISLTAPKLYRCSAGSDACFIKLNSFLSTTNNNDTLSTLFQQSPTFDIINYEIRIWTVVLVVITSFGTCASMYIFYIYITRRKINKNDQVIDPSISDYQHVESTVPLKPMTDQLNPNNLIVLNTQLLGSGVSATVYRGRMKVFAGEYENVAVKVLKDEYVLLVNTNELIDELKVLRRIQHSNIVSFIGHTYIDRTLHIVTEYMAGGSLYDYIQDKNTVLKYQHTFDYMDQILNAMVYLTQQQIVHRDLAARNCLLSRDHTVLKVSDFGLARSVDFKGEYQILHIDTALPTRWIALEAFSHHRFTEKTDVWSFGVLVWELFTRGNTPYSSMDHFQIIVFLNEGHRLQCPVTCPEQIYALIITCWDSEPTKRPTFKQLRKDMANVIRYLTSANKRLTQTEYERPRTT